MDESGTSLQPGIVKREAIPNCRRSGVLCDRKLMWRELISGLFADAKFRAPATASELKRAERELQISLPDELKSLLLETDGVSANYSSPLVWPVEEIVTQNRFFRANPDFAELYMPFDSLLLFGAEGNSDHFGYSILGGQIRLSSFIFEWEHESDGRVWFATDLPEYFRKCVPKDEPL